MLTFYENHGYAFFRCGIDKKPQVKSWYSTDCHISAEEAEEYIETGGYIGAWIPRDHVVIDIDLKGEKHKHDGMQPFLDLCESFDIKEDLLKSTRVVQTASGGFHLYFALPEGQDYTELSQKSLVDGLDVRNHKGFVIAAGVHGYKLYNDAPIMQLPEPFLELMRRKNTEKAKEYNPDKELPPKELANVLKKIPVTDFDTNDSWQEMVTACIATAGNSPEVLDIIEEWSKTDPQYENDPSIRSRLETFEPSGGITAGTFLHNIKPRVSKYLYNKIRFIVGGEFSFSHDFADNFGTPFRVDYGKVHKNLDLMKSFYYSKHQTSGVDLFVSLVRGSLYYVHEERCFYYYNGNLWVEAAGVLRIIFTVLLHAGVVYFTDFAEKNDDDAKDAIVEYIGYIGALTLQQKFEGALKQHPSIHRKGVMWDAPELEGTLTLKDLVMDFTDKEKGIVFRSGRKEEHRRLAIDLTSDDFKAPKNPGHFKQFLKDVFPDEDTRKMATYSIAAMLSGTGKFRKFHIWNGSGNNGKSALMEILSHVIGERAVGYNPDILLSATKKESLTPEVAAFRGALVAFSSETDEAKKISEGTIKHLTGNETISANPKYQGIIHFKTTFQLVLLTNFLPTFSAHDNAFVNRLLVLPFQTCFYETEEMKRAAQARGAKYFKPAGDGDVIAAAVKAERADILYYLASRYQEIGHILPESSESLRAKAHYIKDNNGVMDMIREMLEYNEAKDWFTPTKDIVDFYNADQHTRYSSRFIVSRIKEVYPMVDNQTKRINGKLTRGLKGIRLVYGAYPEGYMGNFSRDEIDQYESEDSEQNERDRFQAGGF